MVAVSRGHKAAAEWLLQHGAAVNATDGLGSTALHAACAEHSGDAAAMIELLLANGVDVHKYTLHQQTALDVAVHYGKVQCAKALIAAGIDVNHVESRGYSALHIAVISNRAAAVQLLLDNGAAAVMNDVLNIKNPNGTQSTATVLMLCTVPAIFKLLLAAGADVHVITPAGNTCLHVAAWCAHPVPVICLLIKAGADLHAVNNRGETAAQIAHDKGNTLIEQLLNRAAQQAR
jgi:ankyrin repeat protein